MISKASEFYFNENYRFCLGEIGRDDFTPYLESLPPIDMVYSALPKPENFPMWYSLAVKPKLSHEKFLTGLYHIWKALDAPIYHTEVGTSNKSQIIAFFERWGKFSYFYEQPLWYSAPLHAHTNGMAKCQNPTEIIVFSIDPFKMPQVKYSHDYVEQVLRKYGTNSNLNCFDPVIGKGLLARYAKKYSHSCYGIEMNSARMNCTLKSISI